MRNKQTVIRQRQADVLSRRKNQGRTTLISIITLTLAVIGTSIALRSQPAPARQQITLPTTGATITALPITLAPTASTTPLITPMPEQLFVVTKDVFSRVCAAPDCPEMAAYQFGEYVTVIQAINAPDGIWYGVQLTDTRVVYLPASALSPVSAGTNRAVPTRRVCPSNCTEAKEWGMSAQDAAACGLDRDGDGAACYGD